MIPRPAVVLHVEDDPGDRDLLEIAFARSSRNIVLRSVPDGEVALYYLDGKGIYADRSLYPLPDLILLDLKLPRKSGFEVLKWIRDHSALCELPVIILSSSAQPKDTERARQNRASDYFVKPVSFDELKLVVAQITAKWIDTRFGVTTS